MASSVLETLKNIEIGRQNCIKNAKLANLPATQNMDIYNLGELFLQQNNSEFINPNSAGWERPSDWWDCKTIIQNAEDIDGLHPSYILLFADTERTTNFTETISGKKLLLGEGYLTSDGSWYLASEGAAIHTWDTTKDKACSLGYKTRYVIVYRGTNTSGGVVLTGVPCLECIMLKNYSSAANFITFGSSSSGASSNTYILNFGFDSLIN